MCRGDTSYRSFEKSDSQRARAGAGFETGSEVAARLTLAFELHAQSGEHDLPDVATQRWPARQQLKHAKHLENVYSIRERIGSIYARAIQKSLQSCSQCRGMERNGPRPPGHVETTRSPPASSTSAVRLVNPHGAFSAATTKVPRTDSRSSRSSDLEDTRRL